jgi:hypothetical protein
VQLVGIPDPERRGRGHDERERPRKTDHRRATTQESIGRATC